MLDVVFRRDSRNRLSSLFAQGHAQWATAGEDIVCAAVSAILQAARLGLVAHARIEVDAHQQGGELALRWAETERDNPAVDAIVHTAELAVTQIAQQYPDHVTVHSEKDA